MSRLVVIVHEYLAFGSCFPLRELVRLLFIYLFIRQSSSPSESRRGLESRRRGHETGRSPWRSNWCAGGSSGRSGGKPRRWCYRIGLGVWRSRWWSEGAGVEVCGVGVVLALGRTGWESRGGWRERNRAARLGREGSMRSGIVW